MSITITCMSCGQTLPATAKFCERCGSPVTAPTVPASELPTPPPPPQQMPPPFPYNSGGMSAPAMPSGGPGQYGATPGQSAMTLREYQRRNRRAGCMGCTGCLTGIVLLVLFAVIGSLALAAGATNDPITVHDDAHVLDARKIQAFNDNLTFDVTIYTTSTFSSSRIQDLVNDARQKTLQNTGLFGNRFKVVTIEIDTVHRLVAVASEEDRRCTTPRNGKRSTCYYVDRSEDSQARTAFTTAYQARQDYTEAALAALRSLSHSSQDRWYERFVRERVIALVGPGTADTLFKVGSFTTIAFIVLVVILVLLLITWARRMVRRVNRVARIR